MSTLVYIIIGILFGAVIALAIVTFSRKRDDGSGQALTFLQNQMSDLARIVDSRLNQSADQMQKAMTGQIGESAKIVRDVTEKLAKLDETNRQVIGFTDQLKNLESVLTNQKKRGSLGEAGLELILSNILPPGSYETQYKFPDGDIADAVIHIKDQLLPIDAKFSLDNYRRIIDESDPTKREALEKEFKNDLKKRIDETSKYIKPSNGTLDFAFMFIPAEGIYYDLLVNEVGAVKVNTQSLIDYAFREKKVIIVSPTTFTAYLQTVLHGLRALKIEESAKEIRKRVEDLGRHLVAYNEYMTKLGNSLGTTVSHYNTAHKELGKIDKDVVRISGAAPGIETLALDKPTLEG